MTRAASLTPKKKRTVRASRRIHGFALTPTDNFWKAKHFVHYEIESKDWGTQVKEYIKANFDRNVVANVNKLPDWKTSNFSHWATTAYLLKTKPEIVPHDYKDKFDQYIKKLSDEGENISKSKMGPGEETSQTLVKKKYTPTIQERIQMQVEDAIEGIEEWLDGFVKDRNNFDPKGFDFVGHFAKHNITQAHARQIIKNYQRELDESRLVANMPSPQAVANIKDFLEKDHALQLREGYGHLNKKDARTFLEALETLVGACEMVVAASKAVRKPRTRAAPSKEKIISKIKYKPTDEKFQLASVNPLELIQSTEVWVFNTKTRKLGRYVAADDSKVMTVKGSSLIGFDSTASVQKTLRRPEETLKEFKASGKVKLRKFMNSIKTTETRLTGKLNADIIILKVSN